MAADEFRDSSGSRGRIRRSLLWLAIGFAIAVGVGASLPLLARRVDSARIDLATLEARLEGWRLRSEEAAKRAQAFDEQRILSEMGRYPKNGAFYRFDDHLEDGKWDRTGTVSDEGASAARGVPDDLLLGFEFEGDDPVGLRPAGGITQLEQAEGRVRILHRSGDYLVSSRSFSVEISDLDSVAIRVKSKRGSQLQFSWGREDLSQVATLQDAEEMMAGNSRLRVDLIPDGEFHTYRISARSLPVTVDQSEGTLTDMVLEPSNVDGDEVEIEFIQFISRMSKYLDAGIGTGYELLGGELRHSLFLTTDNGLDYEVEIPENEPELVFGMGALFRGPISLRVQLEVAGAETLLIDEVIDGTESWRDHRVDLSAWSGLDARLHFAVASADPNVAFLSNPMLREIPPERFNVILYLEDTLRADHLSAYGHERPTSPARDRLAAEGVLFENAFSQAAWTRPSVPSLMTSLLPTATGVWNFSDFLPSAYLTLAEILRHNGFETVAIIQNPNAGSTAGIHQGFSELYDQQLLEGSTESIVDERFLSWLDENRDHNFFAYVHVMDPHGPYDPPASYEKWMAPYFPAENGDPDNATYDPGGWTENLDTECHMKPSFEGRADRYDQEIRHNDDSFGAMLEKLEALGLREDTLIVMTSDHGEYMGERSMRGHHDPGHVQVTHVPMLISYPTKLPRGARIPELAQSIDLMPTILELAEIDDHALLMHGDSLVDRIEGRRLAYWKSRVCLSEEVGGWKSREVTDASGSIHFGKWHFLDTTSFLRPALRALERLDRFLFGGLLPRYFYMEGFDRELDEQELAPSSAFFADLGSKRRLHGLLGEVQDANIELWRELTGDLDQAIRYDPAVQEQLRDLGYIE